MDSKEASIYSESIDSRIPGAEIAKEDSHISLTTSLSSEDQPKFDVEQVQLQFQLNHSLKRLCVQDDKMYLLASKLVYKIDLKNPSKVSQYSLPITNYKITNCWQHTNGYHLIIQVNNNSYYYLHDSYKNFKILPRFKSMEINHITFIDSANSDSTGDFFISTTDGNLYVALIKSHDPVTHENKRDDKYVKQVYKFTGPNKIISGMAISNNGTQINIFVGDTQYTWDCFDTTYNELINVFKSNPPKVEVLSSIEPTESIFASNSTSYAYLNSKTGAIHSNDIEIELSQTKKLDSEDYGQLRGLVLTPHHLVTKCNDNLLIFNKLSRAAPLTLNLKSQLHNEELLGMTADFVSQTYWLFTSNSIYELIVQNESISVWFNYYKMGKYDEALKILSKADSNVHHKKDLVLIKQGYDYLQRGGFGTSGEIQYDNMVQLQVNGIKILAQSSEPFEKVCLMLLNLQNRKLDPISSETETSSSGSTSLNLISEKLLVEYLLTKFEIASTVEKNRIRVMILSSWIIELLLRILHRLESEINENTKDEYKTKLLGDINTQFERFVSQNYTQFDRKTTYQVITDLHYPTKLLFYAELIEDFEFMLNYYINVSDWKEALRTLVKLYTSKIEDRHEVIYKNATVLLVNSPKRTIETWLRLGDGVNYEKFLPSILTYNKNNEKIPLLENYSIQFLSKIIFDEGIKNKQINNYYLSLLITYPRDSRHAAKQIIKFLSQIRSQTSTKKSQLYDSHFILRLCLTYKQFQPAVLILLHDMNLFDQALKLALDNELDDLGEFVLCKYDEFTSDNEDLQLNLDEKRYEFDVNEESTEVEQDISVVSRIKLEEENFSAKKKLWIMFAKHLIDRVCSGKSIKVFEEDEDEQEPIEKNGGQQEENGIKIDGKREKEADEVTLHSVTSDLVSSMMPSQSPLDANVVSKKLNKALKYILHLSNSSGNLGIVGLKDLLPLFPETILINNFKDEIVRSLNQYNNKINQLQLEMKESLSISDNLKQQIKDSARIDAKAKVHAIVKPGEPCNICHTLLLTKSFVIFPNCLHGFHKDCLIRYYLKSRGNYKFKKIYHNFQKNSSALNKSELDKVLCKECHLCNESNIASIDSNIIDPEWDQAEIDEWEL